ncbi:MAG: alpha/beta hydrolase [Candidatus Binatia bacterium]
MLTKFRTLTSILLGMCFVLVSYPLVAESSSAVDDMVVHRDIDYIDQVDYADNKDKLDIFMPVGAKDVPVLVFFHGGALQVGDKSEQGFVATRFIPEGIGVVLANYRLSPLVMHPAHIRDAATAFAWVVKNIEKYGGDPKRIYVSGQSAGAYLALLLSLDPSYLQAHGLDFSSIRATLASSPFTFVEEVAKVRPKTVWGTDPKIWMEASVTPYIGKGKPPILMVYADGDEDWRKQNIEGLKEKLLKAGHTQIKAVEVPNRIHSTVWTDINEPDDQTAKHFLEYMRKYQ